MRIHLYYAPYPSQVFDGEDQPVSTVRVNNPKSALATLAAGVRHNLRSTGIEADIRIIDTQMDPGTRWYKDIPYGPRVLQCYRVGGEFEQYDQGIREANVCGISNNYTNSAGIVGDFIAHIKQVNPRALVVVGGMDVTARPEYYIDRGADVAVQLEGENSFTRVIEAYATGRKLGELVACRPYRHGFVVMSAPPMDMNEIPPMALDLVHNLAAYTDTGEGTPPSTVRPPFTCFETSRGCYHRCSFCATPSRGRYRFMSPQSVRRHFDWFREQGIHNILFQEDNILSRMQRTGLGRFLHDEGRAEVIEIFQMARDYGFSWEFANGLEFGKFLDSGEVDLELMEALFWSDRTGDRWKGCYRVQIPLEFLGDAPTRKFAKLRVFEQELEILQAMLDFGVRYQTFNVIIGHEGDSHHTIDGYLDRCNRLKDALLRHDSHTVPYFNVFNRTLLPGTKDFERQHHTLQFDVTRDPEIISVYLAPFNTEHLTYYELVQRRIGMILELNGDLIDQYDAIHHAVDVGAAAA